MPAKMARHFGVRADELLLANGTDEALSLIVNTFVEPGDACCSSSRRTRCIASTLSWQARELSRRDIDLSEGWRLRARGQFPWDAVMAALREKPRVFFLPNPNSPTGNLLSLAELQRILEGAPRTMRRGGRSLFRIFGGYRDSVDSAIREFDRHAHFFEDGRTRGPALRLHFCQT